MLSNEAEEFVMRWPWVGPFAIEWVYRIPDRSEQTILLK